MSTCGPEILMSIVFAFSVLLGEGHT